MPRTFVEATCNGDDPRCYHCIFFEAGLTSGWGYCKRNAPTLEKRRPTIHQDDFCGQGIWLDETDKTE